MQADYKKKKRERGETSKKPRGNAQVRKPKAAGGDIQRNRNQKKTELEEKKTGRTRKKKSRSRKKT